MSLIQINPAGKIQLSSGRVKLVSACPIDDVVSVTFDGIDVDCLCFSGSGGWLKITDVSVNGSFDLEYFDIGIGSQWEGYGGTVHIRKYANETDCGSEENLVSECDEPLYIVLQCINNGVNPGNWRLAYTAGDPFGEGTCSGVITTSSNWYAFASGNEGILSLPATPDNALTGCGSFVIPGFFSGFAVGRNGTATIEAGAFNPAP